MLPIEAYPTLKFAHVSLVSCSGVLFAVRGAAVLTVTHNPPGILER